MGSPGDEYFNRRIVFFIKQYVIIWISIINLTPGLSGDVSQGLVPRLFSLAIFRIERKYAGSWRGLIKY